VLRECGAISDSMKVAHKFVIGAIRALRTVADSVVKDQLKGIAKLVGTF
jgi:hypothetical protein